MKNKATKKSKRLYYDYKLFMNLNKIRFSSELDKIKTYFQKKIYCDRGFHKIEHNYIMGNLHKSEEKELSVQYIQCKICRTMYFSSKDEKKLFIKINESNEDVMINHLKDLLNNLKK